MITMALVGLCVLTASVALLACSRPPVWGRAAGLGDRRPARRRCRTTPGPARKPAVLCTDRYRSRLDA